MRSALTNKDILDRFSAKSKEPVVSNVPTKVNCSYTIIRNIPNELHSKDLRNYFGRYIEAKKFECFHYRHRPELQADKKDGDASQKNTCCCIVALKTKEDREDFIKEFHKRNWINPAGIEIPKRCFVDRLKVREVNVEGSSNSISEEDLKEMIELKPPSVMPNGNIGTPSEHFLEQIRLCKLPTSIISKLGIRTLKRKKKFGEVSFEYSSSAEPGASSSKFETIEDVKEDTSDPTEKVYIRQNPEDNDEGKDADDDQCEEWERHEALHDDVTEQDRTKPRKYEEEMEVTWEKGGPGLVWYTDKNYWDEREKGTDCDWAWADDWDVDYSVYYEGKSSGDMDAKAAVEMNNDEKLRSGKMEQTVFTRKKIRETAMGNRRKRRYSDSEAEKERAAENLRNGVGAELLTKMGWKPGAGLGKREQGKTVPVAVYVEEDGQSRRERTGFGYRGEKLSRVVQRRPTRHVIASIFDKETDQGSTVDKPTGDETTSGVLFRRAETTTMKYRAPF